MIKYFTLDEFLNCRLKHGFGEKEVIHQNKKLKLVKIYCKLF